MYDIFELTPAFIDRGVSVTAADNGGRRARTGDGQIAMANVPLLKAQSSNMPIGPFQTIVLTSLRASEKIEIVAGPIWSLIYPDTSVRVRGGLISYDTIEGEVNNHVFCFCFVHDLFRLIDHFIFARSRTFPLHCRGLLKT